MFGRFKNSITGRVNEDNFEYAAPKEEHVEYDEILEYLDLVDKHEFRMINDKPVESEDQDLFQVNHHVLALTDFIKDADTPITISLQGDWGTGKTSFINLINAEIQNNNEQDAVETLTFNTWQFSQFYTEDQLGITFLNYLLGELKKKSGSNNEELSRLTDSLKKIGNIMLRMKVEFNGIAVGFEQDDQVNEIAESITKLKKQLEEVIHRNLYRISKKNNGKSPRLVIFIDDLDRLSPSVAVRLLEVIKLFLDVRGCVFVLAVDNKVIEEGIQELKGICGDKAKSFMDKMIQVPYKVPIESYKYEDLLIQSMPFIKNLRSVNHSNFGEKDVQDLIRLTIGSNPRAVKRFINYYNINEKAILHSVDNEDELENKRILLFSILCMQFACQPLYINMINEQISTQLDIINQTYIHDKKRLQGEGEDFQYVFHEQLIEYLQNSRYKNEYEESILENNEKYIKVLDDIKKIISTLRPEVDRLSDPNPLTLTEQNIYYFSEVLKQSTSTASDNQLFSINKEPHYSKEKKISFSEWSKNKSKYVVSPRNSITIMDKNMSFKEKNNNLNPKYAFPILFAEVCGIKGDLDKAEKLIEEVPNLIKQGVNSNIFEVAEIAHKDDPKFETKEAIRVFIANDKCLYIGNKFNAIQGLDALDKMINYFDSGFDRDRIKVKVREILE